MNKIKVYIAGSWKNRSKIKSIMNDIESWGFYIATDWTKHQEKGCARQYAEEDFNGLKECDCLIYCMDSNHSRGKNFELGYVTALGKPIIIYIIPGDYVSDREMLHIDSLTDKECVFIRARLYPIISSMDELRLWLDNLEVKLLLSRVRQKQMEESCSCEDRAD
jgi:nucleoside 2-deoxyribosyltransferase